MFWNKSERIQELEQEIVLIKRRIWELEMTAQNIARGCGLKWKPPEPGQFVKDEGGK